MRELKVRYLRLTADFDNFKKRTAQETEIYSTARQEVFILESLPVIDNLDRAVAINGTASLEQLHRGMQMISLQMLHFLRRHDIEPDDCLGQPFDPHRPEAIGARHDAAQTGHVVLEISQRGWKRGKNVLRPAKVIVNDLPQNQSNENSHSTPSEHD